MTLTRRTMALACAAVLATATASVAQAQARAQGAVTGAQALRQIHDKREMMRKVDLKTAPKIRIGQDSLVFSVKTAKPGFVFVLMAGADNKTLTLLFPNQADKDNRVAAGQELKLPRPSWTLKAGGPPGTNTLLVMVTDGPRNLSSLASEGAFVIVKNDAQGRARLNEQIGRSSAANNAMCDPTAETKNHPLCSNAYGSAMATVEEVQ